MVVRRDRPTATHTCDMLRSEMSRVLDERRMHVGMRTRGRGEMRGTH